MLSTALQLPQLCRIEQDLLIQSSTPLPFPSIRKQRESNVGNKPAHSVHYQTQPCAANMSSAHLTDRTRTVHVHTMWHSVCSRLLSVQPFRESLKCAGCALCYHSMHCSSSHQVVHQRAGHRDIHFVKTTTRKHPANFAAAASHIAQHVQVTALLCNAVSYKQGVTSTHTWPQPPLAPPVFAKLNIKTCQHLILHTLLAAPSEEDKPAAELAASTMHASSLLAA